MTTPPKRRLPNSTVPTSKVAHFVSTRPNPVRKTQPPVVVGSAVVAEVVSVEVGVAVVSAVDAKKQ